MNICVPTMDGRGKEGMPSDHFGSAPYFTFVNTETGEYDAVRNGGSSHVHGACQPSKFLGTRPVDAIVCRGLGRRAFSRLANEGIQVFVTLEKDVEETVAALKDGRLRSLSSEEACQGHGNGHVHSHVHGHGGRGQGGHTCGY